MRSIIAALSIVTLAGCAQPNIKAAGPRSVTVEARGPHNDGKAQDMAEAHCQQYGLHARANQKDDDSQRIIYDCIP